MTSSAIEPAAQKRTNMDSRSISVSLLTGGDDKPYVFGLTNELLSKDVDIELIGSNVLDIPEFHGRAGLTFLNLRGDMDPNVAFSEKILRVLRYYVKLMSYAARSKFRVFHILWNNKFQYFDRTLLMMYYRAMGKQIVMTAHNVNAEKRDTTDTLLNRVTLRIQYKLCSCVFVHTEKMKKELAAEFRVREERISVIPFGINNSVPDTEISPNEAKQRLGLAESEKVILFFGRITPYKGLEYLIEAFRKLGSDGANDYRLVIAGKPDRCEEYWLARQRELADWNERNKVLLHAGFIPDEETEIYFKAADALVLPYRQIYQSGVLFLAHSFGLPVIATDVGSLKDDIVEGETGFVVQPEDADDLVRAIREYFASDLYRNLRARREDIRAFANQRHSWDVVGRITKDVYTSLLSPSSSEISPDRGAAPAR